VKITCARVVRHLGRTADCREMLSFQEIRMSECALCLPLEAKERYKEKLIALKCSVDPYIALTVSARCHHWVTYANIDDFLVSSHSVHSCETQNAFKSLDAYRMVCAKDWLSTLGVKELSGAAVVKCDVKPSQTSAHRAHTPCACAIQVWCRCTEV